MTSGPGYPNKTVIDSLVSTLQRKVEPAKLYDALRNMNLELTEAWDTLFEGPLPAVDGSALTVLNAGALTGEIPDEFNIAYTDRENVFLEMQTILAPDTALAMLQFGVGNPLLDPPLEAPQFLRIGAIADNDFYLSQNLSFDGTDWTQDDVTQGSAFLEFTNGIISVNWWDPVLNDLRKTFRFEGRALVAENFLQDNNVSIATVDLNDVVRLGDSALPAVPNGWVAITYAATSNLPLSGTTDNDGIIGIDRATAPPRFVFFVNGLRYFVAGTPF